MKDFFRGILVVTAALMIFPMIPYLIGAISPAPEVKAVEAEAGVISAPESAVSMPEEVNIYDTVSESVLTLSAEEFVASALAAQLSAEAEPELLKAQAVLMYTYIFRRRIDERVSPTPDLCGCDISTDSAKYPRLALNGDLTPYIEIAREVSGVYCSYEGQPITVAYCYSAGLSTESAETVLGTEVPYLVRVATAEPDAYYTTVSYTSDEVFARLTTTDKGYVLLGDPENWLKTDETAKSGYVKSVLIDSGFRVSGSEIARLLNLPSARFTFRYSPATDRFTFTVSGSGSLAGLSFRGANVLAADGYGYKKILEHFFPGVTVENSDVGEGS